MIHKLAVLVVEKADGTTIATPGEKGEIVSTGKELIRETNDSESHDIFRVTILGLAGVIKERRWKINAPAIAESIPPAAVVHGEEEQIEEVASADVQALREALKAKGVKVPPRISVDNLLALAVEHGVEG